MVKYSPYGCVVKTGAGMVKYSPYGCVVKTGAGMVKYSPYGCVVKTGAGMVKYSPYGCVVKTGAGMVKKGVVVCVAVKLGYPTESCGSIQTRLHLFISTNLSRSSLVGVSGAWRSLTTIQSTFSERQTGPWICTCMMEGSKVVY